MAVPYHTHPFTIPTATTADIGSSRGDVAVTPASLRITNTSDAEKVSSGPIADAFATKQPKDISFPSSGVTRPLISVINDRGPSILDFGGVGDGITDNTAAFASAFAASKSVFVPPGTYSGQIVMPHDGRLVGANRELSRIKCPAGSNKTVIQGNEAYTLFGGSVYDINRGANNVTVTDLTVDGNRAAVSGRGDGIAIWGAGMHIERVSIYNTRTTGLITEWTDGPTNVEARISDMIIDTCGAHGWYNAGPHDSHSINVTVVDAGQNQDNTYYGIYIGPDGPSAFGNGRFFNSHVWHRSGISNRCNAGVFSSGYNEFLGCHFEGCRVNAKLSTRDVVVGSNIYDCFGPAGDNMVYIRGNDVTISATKFIVPEQYTTPSDSVLPNADCHAVFIGTGVVGLKLDGTFIGFKTRTPFNFGGSGGYNTIRGQGYASAGGATTFSGAMNVNDSVDYSQSGTVINFTKPRPYIVASNDAAAASAGIPVNGVYRDASGLVRVRIS